MLEFILTILLFRDLLLQLPIESGSHFIHLKRGGLSIMLEFILTIFLFSDLHLQLPMESGSHFIHLKRGALDNVRIHFKNTSI